MSENERIKPLSEVVNFPLPEDCKNPEEKLLAIKILSHVIEDLERVE